MGAAGLLAFFMPGPIEILILGLLVLLMVGGPLVALVVVLVVARRGRTRSPFGPPNAASVSRCPNCGEPLPPAGASRRQAAPSNSGSASEAPAPGKDSTHRVV